MALIVVWSHVIPLVAPFFASLTAAAVLALPLHRAAEDTGLPRLRERCVGCVGEPELRRTGTCPERCSVNSGPTVPLVLFVATATTAIFAFGDPAAFDGYVLPGGTYPPGVGAAVAAGLVGANAVAAVLLAAFFVQDRQRFNELFARGAALTALFGFVAIAWPLGPLGRWVDLALPLALIALLFAAGIEWRARHGRPTFGLRTLGIAALPLFAVCALAAIRIVQILVLAGY